MESRQAVASLDRTHRETGIIVEPGVEKPMVKIFCFVL